MNQEFYYHLLQGIRAKVTGYICLIAAVGLVSSVPLQQKENTKVASLLGALALAVAGQVSVKTQKENDAAIEDFRVNSGIQRQRKLFGLPKQDVIEAEVEDAHVEWFDFSTIGNDRDKFPNVIIMGEPGSGKTSLAEYLGVVLKANKRYAVHPHAKPGDFAGFNAVLGGGRNYGTPDDEEVTWADIESVKVKPTIAQTLKALLVLMNERYKRYYQGDTAFDDVDVYIDELPSIVSNLGKKFFASIMPQLLMECRKVGIRLWLLAQGSQVRMLGLEGMSDLREGITFIRLGRLALKHNRDKAVEIILQQMARPCLVDDSPAKLPGWSEMSAAIRVWKPAEVTEVKPAKVSAELESLRSQLHLMDDDVSEPEEYTEDDYLVYEGKRTLIYDIYLLADDCIDAKGNERLKELPKIVEKSNFNTKVMLYIGERLVRERAKAVTYVVRDAWGMGGRRYDEGRNLYYDNGLDKFPKGNSKGSVN